MHPGASRLPNGFHSRGFPTWTAACAVTTALVASGAAAASPAVTTEPPLPIGEPLTLTGAPGYPAPSKDPTGFFFRASGGWSDLREDALLRDGSGAIATDDGLGLSLAVGYRDFTRPFVFEVEYAFRQVETDPFVDPGTALLADNDLDIHTISANLLFDAPSLIGPVGVYAGAGIGARLSEARIRLGGEDGSVTTASGEDLFVQAMAGITVTLDQAWQLHAGVRWSDGGTIDDGALRYETEAIAIEAGFRLFF